MLINIIMSLFSLFFCTTISAEQQPYTISDNDQTRIFVEQEPNIPNQPCSNKDLKQCIFAHMSSDQRKIFSQLPPEKRKEFFAQLTLDDYDKFLDAYSQQEWNQLLYALSLEEKNYYPQTVEEQKKSIQTIKDDAQTVRNICFTANLVADAVFPPAMIIHVVELGYVMVYNIHPIVQEEQKKQFKEYVKEKFNVIQPDS